MTSISKPPVDNLIASKDRAETFAESDVTVSHSDTLVSNESVKLPSGPTGNTISRPADDKTSSLISAGLEINPNTDLSGVRATVSSLNDAVTGLSVMESDGTIINSKSISGNSGDTFEIKADMAAGTTYLVEFDSDGSFGGYDTPSFPYTGTDMDITAGSYNDSGGRPDAWSISTIEGIVSPASGTVIIQWPTPEDVYRWDAATFQSTPDGETVDVFIQESTDGGSTWNDIAGPISRGQDIPAAPGSRCRFRVELSRADTGNNPTLDSIYRRWVV